MTEMEYRKIKGSLTGSTATDNQTDVVDALISNNAR